MDSILEYQLHLSSTKALEHIECVIDDDTFSNIGLFANGVLFGCKGDKDYIGKVSGQTFRIQKRIRYRNSFNPILYGIVKDTRYGCRVDGRFRQHPLIAWFCVFWCLFYWWIFISILLSGAPLWLIVNPIFVTGLVVTFGIFRAPRFGKVEENDVKEMLANLFAPFIKSEEMTDKAEG